MLCISTLQRYAVKQQQWNAALARSGLSALCSVQPKHKVLDSRQPCKVPIKQPIMGAIRQYMEIIAPPPFYVGSSQSEAGVNHELLLNHA